VPTPRQWFRNALDDFRATRTGPNRRAQIRADVAELVNAALDWSTRNDVQERAATEAFAQSRQGQFNAFLDTLPPVDPDQTP
jgi:hypothetical protein